MGCNSSKPQIKNDSDQALPFKNKSSNTKKTESSLQKTESQNNSNTKENGKQSRARRLSQTVFEAENVGSNAEEPITISVPIPVLVGEEANKPVRRRKDRRSSYIQFDTDPRNAVAAVASACVAGAESHIPKRNQDAILTHMDDHACLFAVFDGHGHQGHHCSHFLKTSLPGQTKVKLLEDISTGQAISSALQQAEANMIKAHFDCSLSGTTATIVMIQASRLIVCWVGDSPSFIISTNDQNNDLEDSGDSIAATGYQCTSIAPPHNFQKSGERERILAAGGRVMHWQEDGEFIGPLRVFMSDRPTPGLNMSRSLGDVLAHRIGVSSEAEAVTRELDHRDKFIVLGSDGLTEFMSFEEIMTLILRNSNDLQNACDEAVSEARKRWIVHEEGTIDDISIIVIKLNALPTQMEAV